MNTIFKTSIATILLACASFTASAAANDETSQLASIVKNSIQQTVTQANKSIDLGLQKSILTNVHNLSFGEGDVPVGQVKIIDLASNNQVEKENSDSDESTKAE